MAANALPCSSRMAANSWPCSARTICSSSLASSSAASVSILAARSRSCASLACSWARALWLIASARTRSPRCWSRRPCSSSKRAVYVLWLRYFCIVVSWPISRRKSRLSCSAACSGWRIPRTLATRGWLLWSCSRCGWNAVARASRRALLRVKLLTLCAASRTARMMPTALWMRKVGSMLELQAGLGELPLVRAWRRSGHGGSLRDGGGGGGLDMNIFLTQAPGPIGHPS